MIEPAVILADRYELGPVIGRGGMAEVRTGRDTRLERPVAVKLLRPELAHQREVRARFESEARLAARLSHPNVVAVYDSGEAQGVPFIVMERLSGDTLHDRLAAGPMRPEEVTDMAIQVLGALETAHAAGVLHRDIKPGNILAGAGSQWKIGDFGIAKALEADSSDGAPDMTATGLLIGTPAYLAPERFFGAPATVASDLYSLAVVLYEAVAGAKPFRTTRPDAWASLVAGTEPPPLSRIRPGGDPALGAVIMRGMAKDPAQRYPSAGAMAAAVGAAGATGATARVSSGAAAEGDAAADQDAVDWPPLDLASSAAVGAAAAVGTAAAVGAAAAPDRHPGAEPTTTMRSGPPATDVLPVWERPDGSSGYRSMRSGGAGSGAAPAGLRLRGAAAGGVRGLASDVRARMAVAGVIALAVIIALAVALSGSHHSGSTTTSVPTTARTGTATAPAPTAPASTAPAAGTGAGTAGTAGAGTAGAGAGTIPAPLGKALHHLQQTVKR